MSKIPQTDSVAELARFWDTHDLTEFDDELEEVNAPVFERGTNNVLRVTLPPDDAAALHRAAESRGVKETELVTTLKRQATRVLADRHDTGEPVLITEHGKPSAYLVDVDSYEFMQDRMHILEGIARGERAIQEKRTFPHAEAKRKVKKWLGWSGPNPRWPVFAAQGGHCVRRDTIAPRRHAPCFHCDLSRNPPSASLCL